MPYKDPQLSAQAKRLRSELTKFGATVTHAQALELAVRMQGARTVHVAQAKNNAPIDIPTLALQQATDLAFETTGRYGTNISGLIAAIKSAFEQESLGSRYVEDAVHLIFGTANAPKVSALFDSFRLEDVPAQFESTVKKLTATLDAKARVPAPSKGSDDNTVFEAKVYDWRVTDGSTLQELPEHHRQQFDLRVTRSPQQLFVDMTPAGISVDQLNEEGVNQMTLFIEVNEGRPCVHMSNSVYGDQVLTVFFTPDGLYLRPDDNETLIRFGTPGSGALRTLDSELAEPFKASTYNPTQNCAHILTS